MAPLTNVSRSSRRNRRRSLTLALVATALAAGLALSSCTVGDMFVESSADEAVAETGSENAPPARVVPQLNEVPDCQLVGHRYRATSADLKRVYSEGTVKLAN